MPIFKTTIKGHLDLTRKLPELPDVIEQIWIDEAVSPQQLTSLVVERLQQVQQNQGMGTRIPQESGKILKAFVPMHMIVYINTEIKASPESSPVEDPENPGEYLDNGGNKLRKQ